MHAVKYRWEVLSNDPIQILHCDDRIAVDLLS